MSVINIYDRRKMQKRPKQYKFLSSQNFEIPPGYRSCDIFCVGGGAAAGCDVIKGSDTSFSYSRFYCGKVGGPGGYCRTVKNINVNPKDTLTITIGNGGKPCLSWFPSIKKSDSTELKNKFIGCHILLFEKKNKVIYFIDRELTGYHDGRGIYISYDYKDNFSIKFTEESAIASSFPNLGGGENSFVKYNNKKIAEAPGATPYIKYRYGYQIYSLLNNRHLIYSETSGGSHPPLFFKNYFSFGGNLGGGNESSYYIQTDSLVDLKPHYENGHVGEENGGIHIYDGRYYNYFTRKTPPFYTKDFPELNWDQLSLPAYITTHYGYPDTVYPHVGDGAGTSITMPSIKDVITSYDKLFGQQMSFNFTDPRHSRVKSGTATTDPFYIIGNQNTLGYWLGQSNTRAFGEENGELFAGGGGSSPTGYNITDNNNNGGAGGGGNGYKTDGTPAQDGLKNTGGGGGYGVVGGEGTLWDENDHGPGFGGSGIVIIRFYPNENRNTNVNWDENTEIKV